MEAWKRLYWDVTIAPGSPSVSPHWHCHEVMSVDGATDHWPGTRTNWKPRCWDFVLTTIQYNTPQTTESYECGGEESGHWSITPFSFGFTLIVETKQNSRLLSVIGGFVTQFQLSSLNFSKMNLPWAKIFLNGCCFTDLAARLYCVAL